MAEKCILQDVFIEDMFFDENCCGCDTSAEGTMITTSNPYISYRVGGRDMFNFSPTQWIIPIKFYCGCREICFPGVGCTNSEQYAKIHSVNVLGSNPANVSFVFVQNTAFSNTLPSHFGGQTYTETISGWCMVVDKDLGTVLTAESSGGSGITIEVQKCAQSTPFQFQLFTEYFFADNFRRYSDDTSGNCNSTSGSTTPYYLWCGADNASGHLFLDGNALTGYNECKKDNTTYFSTPVVFFDKCLVSLSGGSSFFQALKTIQDIRVVGSNEPLTWGSNAGVWATYNQALGLWYINVDKDGGGTYHVNTTSNPLIASTVDLEIDVFQPNAPCNIPPGGSFNNQPMISTITVTVPLGHFNVVGTCPF